VNSLEPTLLGFDIRIPPEETTALWSPKKRESFLLNPETSHPLSVDDYVWPSVFRYHMPPTAILQRTSTIPINPKYTEKNLWLNLAKMRDCYGSSVGASERRGVEVAIELMAKSGITLKEFPSSLLYQEKLPSDVPESAFVLGFDVADAGLTSGLNNTTYTVEDKHGLQGWSSRLNEYGLFRALEDAHQFRAVTDERNPRHAPHWVYKLLRLN